MKTKEELEAEIDNLCTLLGKNSLLLLEGVSLLTHQLLITTILERRLTITMSALRVLRDDPTMTGWAAHNIAEYALKEVEQIKDV